MDVIKVWKMINNVLNYINDFNSGFKEQSMLDMDLLISYIQNMYEIGMTDAAYWQDTEVDFPIIRECVERVHKAGISDDYTEIYDIVNYDLSRRIRCVADVIFDKDIVELQTYFWNINKNALKMRYPETLEDIEKIPMEREQQCFRSYGIRGRVVYRTEKENECDLYSGYNPIGLSRRMMEMINVRKYKKIYIWGSNTGFEANGIVQPAEGKIEVTIYIDNLAEFKQVLLNTSRTGVLLYPDIKYRFHMGLRDLIENFDLQKKDDSYIYVCVSGGEDVSILRQFICNNLINSNIEVIDERG